VNINHADAKTACAALGGQYHLITNAEWMTIARSIEATATNWSTGTINSGAINRGHTDGTPANTLAASTDDDACNGTGQSCATFNDQRRAVGILATTHRQASTTSTSAKMAVIRAANSAFAVHTNSNSIQWA
jgi:hypothetical protein